MDISRSTLFGGLTVLDSVVSSYQYAPHWHDEFVIAVYRGGVKCYRCAHHNGSAVAGDVLIIAPGTLHSATTFDDGGWDYCALYFTPDQLSKATGFSKKEIDAKFQDFLHIENSPRVGRMAIEALDAGDEAELALSDWLVTLPSVSSESRRKRSPIYERLANVYQRIMDDPVSQITMNELAFLAGVTHEHLSRSFKQTYGVSPFQLIIAARIHLAHKHISLGIELADAAVLAGFSDQSHMNRWVKRAYGVSPRILRDINYVQDYP